MTRIALAVEYQGAAYYGWQSQAGGNTVQDALEHALYAVSGVEMRVHAAGRTDTGVHALSQIVHFDTEVNRPESAWMRGTNAFLPDDIRVKWAKAVDGEFHARFSATHRHYQYVLVNQPHASAIHATSAGWYHQPLDVVAMQAAIAYLKGEHDFSAFRASACQAKSPVKTISHAVIKQTQQYLVFEFSANAFLHHQVRNMIGALIYIGNGKYPPEHIKSLLKQKDRTQAPPTFSPNGLYLTGVDYDEKWQLPPTRTYLTLL